MKHYSATTFYICLFVILHILVSVLCFSAFGIGLSRQFALFIEQDIRIVYLIYLCFTVLYSVYLIVLTRRAAENSSDRIVFTVLLAGIAATHGAFIALFLLFMTGF